MSAETRASRRLEFIHAAWRCFDRSGVPAVTMEQITREAGYSSGAIYVHFASKEAVITAAMAESAQELARLFGAVVARAADLTPTQFVREALTVLDGFRAHHDVDLLRIGMQAWAFSVQDSDLGALLRQSYGRLRAGLEAAARTWGLAPGRGGGSLDAGELLATIALGYTAQHALLGDTGVEGHVRGLTAIAAAMREE
jgi:TetR/AcrR family transcriptional regulator, transcriptional repressor of aconitase